jgi:hypothetical protein
MKLKLSNDVYHLFELKSYVLGVVCGKIRHLLLRNRIFCRYSSFCIGKKLRKQPNTKLVFIHIDFSCVIRIKIYELLKYKPIFDKKLITKQNN